MQIQRTIRRTVYGRTLNRKPRDKKVSISVSADELAAIIRMKRPGQSVSVFLRSQFRQSFWTDLLQDS